MISCQRYLINAMCRGLKWRKPSRQVRKCPVRSRKIGEHKLGSGPHGHERDHRGREQEGRQEEVEEGGGCRRRRLLRRLMRHLMNASISLSSKLNSTHLLSCPKNVCVQHQDNFLSYACNISMNKTLETYHMRRAEFRKTSGSTGMG